MERPTITIEGKTYEMPRPKGGVWRRLLEFDKENDYIFSEDFIEKRCEFLSELYGGQFTADELLDNLYLEEIAQAYRDTLNYLIGRIAVRFEEAEKNADAGDKTE